MRFNSGYTALVYRPLDYSGHELKRRSAPEAQVSVLSIFFSCLQSQVLNLFNEISLRLV